MKQYKAIRYQQATKKTFTNHVMLFESEDNGPFLETTSASKRLSFDQYVDVLPSMNDISSIAVVDNPRILQIDLENYMKTQGASGKFAEVFAGKLKYECVPFLENALGGTWIIISVEEEVSGDLATPDENETINACLLTAFLSMRQRITEKGKK